MAQVITVLGSSGLIGSQLCRHLESTGAAFQAVDGRAPLPAGNLGHLVYCIGVTSDFRSRPLDAVEAHVCKIRETVMSATFDSILYLSSTRVYRRSARPQAAESDELTFDPAETDDLYGLSKAMGEAVVLADPQRGKVVRLSNVYSSDVGGPTFLATVLRRALTDGFVELRSSIDTERDYVDIGYVVAALAHLAAAGKSRVYNVASGVNTTNGQLMTAIGELTGADWRVADGAPVVRFPSIDVSRLRAEIASTPSNVLRDLPAIVAEARVRLQ